MILETIFNQLLGNQKYFNTVYPHLDVKLFPNKHHQDIFRKMAIYVEKYSKRPEAKDLRLLFSTDQNISVEETETISTILTEIEKIETSDNIDLLIDETERWVQDRSMEIAILESVEILEQDKPRGMIEQKVKDALSISFKQNLGMEFYLSAPDQFKFYTSEDELFECDIDLLNQALGGGYRRKALYMFIGGVNVGKTLWMCHFAASFIRNGYNVVYLTGEMAENAIYKRVDANVLDMEMNDLAIGLDKKSYYGRVKQHAQKKGGGRLFVKEYPTGFGNRNHILAYLQDLSLKKAFKPDIMIVDYLNIFASSRLPASQAADSYHYMKAVAEEFRAIAVELNITVISPTQLNRESFKKSADTMDMTGQADSFAIPALADWMGAIISSKELFEDSKYLLKTLKTRFGENIHEVITIGVARKHMRLLNVSEEDQDIPVAMKDKMSSLDERRKIMSNEDQTFVFEDEIITEGISLEDMD